jgi:hypothetical protein
MAEHRIFKIKIARVHPHQARLRQQIAREAPASSFEGSLIKGVVCGGRVEENCGSAAAEFSLFGQADR